MKITVGLGSIDDYIPFVEAGADECFCGYVSEDWAVNVGRSFPLNRREVLYYNVQIGSFSELSILSEMIKKYKVPVSIAVNSLSYAPQYYPQIAQLMNRCAGLGFSSFIVADPALLSYLRRSGLDRSLTLHVSGEISEVNHFLVERCREHHCDRIIFHRKTTLDDMAAIIYEDRRLHPNESLDYEAFVLNEMCHYHGGFCNTLHCDALCHMCRVPYRLGTVCGQASLPAAPEIQPSFAEEHLTGETGCGLCALWRMKQMGITHLKLVSRGNYAEDTLEDIRHLRCALDILDSSAHEEEYIHRMKRALFPGGCSGNCYYFGQI